MTMLQKITAWLIIFVFALLFVVLAAGCTVKTTPAQARQEEKFLTVEIPTADGGKITVRDNRGLTATTQPSVKTFGVGALPRFGSADMGGITSLSFDQVEKTFKNNWHLGLIFLAVAAGFYFLKRWVPMALSLAAGVLSILYPAALVYAAAVVIAYLAWSARATIKQLVSGNEKALKNLPPDEAESARGYMAEEHDAATKAVVRAVK